MFPPTHPPLLGTRHRRSHFITVVLHFPGQLALWQTSCGTLAGDKRGPLPFPPPPLAHLAPSRISHESLYQRDYLQVRRDHSSILTMASL